MVKNATLSNKNLSKAESKKYKEELWERFLSGEDSVYNDLLMAYYPLVEATAKRLKSSLPQHVDLEDLISDGFIGLMEAVKRFDNSQGYKFETYAPLRIRGEIIDKLRISDWAPRSLRLKYREIDKAYDLLTSLNKKEPTNKEIANLLGWTLEEVEKIQSESAMTSFINIDESIVIDGSQLALSEVIADMNVPVDPEEFKPLSERVVAALSSLSQQDQAILALFYIENVPVADIAEVMGISETRVCQMQTSALSALRELCVPR